MWELQDPEAWVSPAEKLARDLKCLCLHFLICQGFCVRLQACYGHCVGLWEGKDTV